MQHGSRHVDACATLERGLVEAGGTAGSSMLAGELRHRGKEREPAPLISRHRIRLFAKQSGLFPRLGEYEVWEESVKAKHVVSGIGQDPGPHCS